MKKLIGPHCAGAWSSHLDILRQWQPPVALVLSPERDKVQQLRDACPNTIVIGRFYHDDNHYASNISSRPQDFAREIHNEILNNPATPLLDYVQSNNETNQDWEGIQKLNVYSQEWMHLADQSGAYKCAILAFSVGNPDLPDKPGDPAGYDGRMLYWQQVLPSLNYAQQRSHLLLMHAYDYPHMFRDPNWYIYRYERQVQNNLRSMGITNLKYVYGEIGIDGLIVGKKEGYKAVTGDQDYVNQNLQWERDEQGQGMLLGGCIYTFGDSGGWGSYDITTTNVARMIAQHYADHAGDYTANGGGDDDDTQIFIPIVGTGGEPVPAPQRNFDPRAMERGVTIDSPNVTPGTKYWFAAEVKWYDEQQADQLGPDHHIMVDATIDGQRAAGEKADVQWPGDHVEISIEAKPGEPYGGNFPMTPGEYSVRMIGQHPSEVVAGIEMGAMTPGGWNAGIHSTTGVRYELRTMQAMQPEPTPPTPDPGPTPPTPQPTPPGGSVLIQPCAGRVSQRWGENPEDYAQFGIPGHNGTDIANVPGTSILAIAGGVVAFVGVDVAYGNYVRLHHQELGLDSFYAHLQDSSVAAGQVVSQGQQIGRMGFTGNVDPQGPGGSHLHLEIRLTDDNGQYLPLTGGYGKGRIDPAIAYHLLNR